MGIFTVWAQQKSPAYGYRTRSWDRPCHVTAHPSLEIATTLQVNKSCQAIMQKAGPFPISHKSLDFPGFQHSDRSLGVQECLSPKLVSYSYPRLCFGFSLRGPTRCLFYFIPYHREKRAAVPNYLRFHAIFPAPLRQTQDCPYQFSWALFGISEFRIHFFLSSQAHNPHRKLPLSGSGVHLDLALVCPAITVDSQARAPRPCEAQTQRIKMADLDYSRRNKSPRPLSEAERERLEEFIDSIHYSAR
jgi:hypothetical protein